MLTCLRPAYVADFRCDGNFCHSACCKGWRITVDEPTLAKYRAVADDTAREKILAGIVKDDERHKTHLKDNGDCYFLRDDGLCSLQRNHGEEFLADVCHDYPRVTFRLSDDYAEQSLTVTCPIAAQLVLASRDGLQFTETPLNVARENFVFDMRQKGLPPLRDTLDIEEIGIGILQDRRFSIDERLFLLSCFCEELDKKSKSGTTADLTSENHLAQLLSASEERMLENRFSPRRFVAYITELFSRVYDTEYSEERTRSMMGLYALYNGNFLADVMTTKRHIAENYAVNKFFMTLCPWTNDGTYSYNCRVFTASCKLLEFAVFITAAKNQGTMPEAELIRIMTCVSERLDHNRESGNTLRNFVTEKEMSEKEFRQTLLNTAY